jgi:hypothetical protein
MTTIKTWQERTEFNGPCYPPEAQEEITDLRAALVKGGCTNCVHLSARDSVYDVECMSCSHYYASKFEEVK